MPSMQQLARSSGLRERCTVIDGPSIVDGTPLLGFGYRNIPPGIGNNKVYAFTLAGSKNGGGDSKAGQK